MLWWLIDNIGVFQTILGMIALGYGAAFYMTKRVKFLAVALAIVAVIVLLWLLPRFIITDRKRLELTVREMADAVVNGNFDTLRAHLADDFTYAGASREEVVQGV